MWEHAKRQHPDKQLSVSRGATENHLSYDLGSENGVRNRACCKHVAIPLPCWEAVSVSPSDIGQWKQLGKPKIIDPGV